MDSGQTMNTGASADGHKADPARFPATRRPNGSLEAEY
jgi:hypothetical protein